MLQTGLLYVKTNLWLIWCEEKKVIYQRKKVHFGGKKSIINYYKRTNAVSQCQWPRQTSRLWGLNMLALQRQSSPQDMESSFDFFGNFFFEGGGCMYCWLQCQWRRDVLLCPGVKTNICAPSPLELVNLCTIHQWNPGAPSPYPKRSKEEEEIKWSLYFAECAPPP